MPAVVALLAALVSGGRAAPAPGNELLSLTPLGASAGVAVRLTATGLDPVATNNEVVLRTASGHAVRVEATSVTTLDATSGTRRLTFIVPQGLPVGPVTVTVVNRTTGRTSTGKVLEVIALTVNPATLVLGTTGATVRLTGSPNAVFTPGRTLVTLGEGLTVRSTTVDSPTSVLLTVDVGSSAAPGPRPVSLISSLHQAVLPDALLVTALPPPANRPPVAHAGGPYPEVTAGTTVTFDGRQSTDPDGDPLEFRWDFGDGTSASGAVADHVFGAAGTYAVSLTVTDSSGASDTATVAVVVRPMVDTLPPSVALAAPAAVVPGSVVTLTATASDAGGLASVHFEIDGVAGPELTAPPFTHALTVAAVAVPGQTIAVRAVARDRAGNAAHAEARVLVTTSPDLVAPTVGLAGPATSPPGGTVWLVARADDEGGVAGVTFLADGREIAHAVVPPYEATWTVPATAGIGSTIVFEARAVDFSGNAASVTLPVTVSATADTTPPSVTLSAPAEIWPGGTLIAGVEATDESGVARVTFLVNDDTIAVLTTPPYETSLRVPVTSRPGASWRVEVVVVDFAGNRATAGRRVAIVAPPTVARAVVTGEVYDDTKGIPLGDVAVIVTVTAADGTVHETRSTTDARGRYAVRTVPGQALVRLRRPGWTSATRVATLAPAEASELLDARLTPVTLATGTAVAGLGGSLVVEGAELSLPPGLATSLSGVRLTPLSQQGLCAPLPPGWTPVAAVDLDPHTLVLPADTVLRTAPLVAGDPLQPLVLARWDDLLTGWRAVGPAHWSADGRLLEASIVAGGQYAWLLADREPVVPPSPRPGDLLAGVTGPVLPGPTSATLVPVPRVLFYRPGVSSRVTATVVATGGPGAFTSGSRLLLQVAERYRFLPGTEMVPAAFTQDLVFHQRPDQPGVLSATTVVAPSQDFEPTELDEGVITVELRLPGAPRPAAVVGPAGGSVPGPQGTTLWLPAGALTDVAEIRLDALSPEAATVTLPEGFALLAGVSIVLDEALAVPATLDWPRSITTVDPGRLLLARVTEVGGRTHLVLVARLRSEGDRLVSDVTVDGRPTSLEGVRVGGRYVLIATPTVPGFADGRVRSTTGLPVSGAVVSATAYPVVGLSGPVGTFTVPGTAGAATLTALDPGRGDVATALVTLDPGRLATADLRLVKDPLRVIATSPVDGAVSVALSDPVVLTFSRPLDPASVAGALATRVAVAPEGGAPVPGVLTLSHGNRVLTFRPAEPLTGNTRYRVTVLRAITDLAGDPMTEDFHLTFESLDTAPPPVPPAGAIAASLPDADGTTTVTATQGTAGPRDTVWIRNRTTGALTPVLVDASGGFSVRVAAQPSHVLEVVIVDPAGNETRVEVPRFRREHADGSVSVALTADGGVIDGPGGVRADIRPGTFPDGAIVTLQVVEPADFPVTLGPEHAATFRVDRGVRLDFGGVRAQKHIDLSIPPVGGETEDMRWVVVQVVDVDGRPVLSAVDTARFRGGRITTASPPCPGVTAAGTYGFVRSQQAVGVNFSSAYTGPGAALLIGLKYVAAGISYLLPYGVFADRFADLLCYPVLTATVTLTANTTQVVVPGDRLTPADRQVRIRSRSDPTARAVALGRDVLEFTFDVTGSARDSFRVVGKGTDASMPGRARTQLLTRVSIAAVGPDRVRLRIDPDPITIVLDEIVVTNLTRGEETAFPARAQDFVASVAGGDGDEYQVTLIDVAGRERTLTDVFRGQASLHGAGNLVLRALPGSIDPTREEMDARGLSGPARTRLFVSAKRSGRVVVIPNDRVVNGGTAFAFEGAADDDYTLTVEYDLRGPYTIELPRVELVVRNPVTGRVLRTISTFAPPPDLPQDLGVVSDDTSPPYVIAGPTRLARFDPSGDLTFTFSEPMDAESLRRAFTVQDSRGVTVKGQVVVSGDGRMARFVPAGGLRLGERYTVEIRGGEAGRPGDRSVAMDRAGNVMPTVRLRLRTFVPRRVGAWNGDGPDDPALASALAPYKDIAIPPRTSGGPAPTTLFVTTGGPVYNLAAVDTRAPDRMALQAMAEGPTSRQRALLLPRIAFRRRTGEDFAGDVLVTSTFTLNASRLDFYDVTPRGQTQDIRLLGFKILTENPDLAGPANRYNTVLADGLVKGLAAITTPQGVTVYAAVERVGLMTADLGLNTPGRPVNERVKEGLYPGDFTDVAELDGALYAISRPQRRLEILGANLARIASLPLSAVPRRIRLVADFLHDRNGDGLIEPDERLDLAFIGSDRAIAIVDITDPAMPRLTGAVPLPGIVRDLDVDLERRRAFALVDTGAQLLLAMIDVTNPGLVEIDDDRDGMDDRVIWTHSHPGANGLRIDASRGLLFVAGLDRLEAWAAYDICCDVGIDLLAPPSTETGGEFAVLLRREKLALQKGIGAGLDAAAARCGLLRDDLRMLESGSGACVWDPDPVRTCGRSYRPGLSDHDLSVFFSGRAMFAAAPVDGTVATCTILRLTEQFTDLVTDEPKPIEIDGVDVTFQEISFLVNALGDLRAAQYPLWRTDKSLPGDPTNDMALGRQILLLRHLLEGRWVRGIPGWGSLADQPFEDLLTKLRTETGIPRVNGYEAAKLQEFALAKGKVYVRIRGASEASSSLHPIHVKQVHAAAKAAIRAVVGRLVVDDRARERLLAIRRTAAGPPGTREKPNLIFDENACVIIDPALAPDLWQHGPCSSLEEFFASMAARTLRWWGTQPPLTIFTRDQIVNQVARFYRVKVDLETIDSEQEADEFIAEAHRFVQWVLQETRAAYEADLPTDPRRAEREDNMREVTQKLIEARSQAKFRLVPRAFNRGFAVADKLRVAMYTASGTEGYGDPQQHTAVTLEPGSEQFLKYQRTRDGAILKDRDGKAVPLFEWGPIDQTADPGLTGAVAFTIDLPARSVKEAERANNITGFRYYILDLDAPGPPAGVDAPLPRPVSDAVLAPDPECEGDPALTLTQTLHLLPGPGGPAAPRTLLSPATILQHQTARHAITVRNDTPLAVEDITLCETLSGQCRQLGTLSPGGERVTVVPVPTTGDAVFDVVPTVYSEFTGIQRGSPFRIIVTCERYQMTALGPTDTARVMRGGTSIREFRVVDRLTGTPLASAPVRVRIEGANAGEQAYTTNALGFVGTETGDPARPFLPGVRIAYPPQATSGHARVTVLLDLGPASTCTATSQSYDLEFVPFESSHGLKAGAAIQGAGIKFLGGKAKLGASAGLSLGLSRHDDETGSHYQRLKIGRSFAGKLGVGVEADLFKGEVRAIGTARLQGPSAEAMATLEVNVGDAFEFGDVRYLNDDDRHAIAGLLLDTASRAMAHPVMSAVLSHVSARVTRRPRRVSWSTGASLAKGMDFTLAKLALGFNQPHRETGETRRAALGVDLDIGAGFSTTTGLSVTRNLKDKAFEVVFSQSGGLSGQAGLDVGLRAAKDTVEAGSGAPESKDAQKLTIEKLTDKASVGIEGGASISYSLGITTPDYLDLSRLPAGTELWPSKIEVSLTGDLNWGYKRTQPAVPLTPGTTLTPETNLGAGATHSFSYSVTSKDLIKHICRSEPLVSSFLLPDQPGGSSSSQVSIASDRTLFELLGRFVASLLPDGEYTRSIERGTGVEFPIGIDLSAAGEGIELSVVPLKVNRSVSYPLLKGVIKDGRAYDIEDYSQVHIEPADLSILRDLVRAVTGEVARDIFRKGRKRYPGSGSDDDLLAGPRPQPAPGDDAQIGIPGEVTLRVASADDLDRIAGLFSFDFTSIPGPVRPAPFPPEATAGPADKPHYGVGGFHHLEAPTTALTVPGDLTIHYDESQVAGGTETDLRVYRWDSDREDWALVGGTVNAAANTVTATVTRLGTYTLAVPMPAGPITWTVTAVTRVPGTDGHTDLRLRSNPLRRNDGTPVPPGTLVHVASLAPGELGEEGGVGFGTILTPDADALAEGVQLPVGIDGTVDVEIRLPGDPFALRLLAFSDVGTAAGEEDIVVPRP